MSVLIISVHVFVCILLIMIVLLQTGKGADMGAAFGGGGSQALFGSTGATTFLGKATTVIAIVFMLTSLILAYTSGQRVSSSIMFKEQAPIEQKTPAKETTAQPPQAVEQTATPTEPAVATPSVEPTENTAN